MKRILCLWLPHWPLQRLLVAQPELERLAVVLHARDRRGVESVVTCSPQAWVRGIRPGMSLPEASALSPPTSAGIASGCRPNRSRSDTSRARSGRPANRPGIGCPQQQGLQFQRHDPQTDRQALEGLAQRCESFSPLVGLDHPQQAQGLWLEITGVTQRWGGEGELARQLAEMVRQQGYQAQLALADTLGASWALARYGFGSPASQPPRTSPQPRPSHELALRQIAAGQTLQVLGPLPVQALRLSEATVELLQRLGVERIEQLLELPRAGLATRLGPEVLQRLDQATGELEEILVPYRPAPRFQAQWTLDHPTCQRSALEQVIQHLCHHVAQQLAVHHRGAMQVRCHLLNDTPHPVVMEVALFHSTAQAGHLFQLLRMQLESIRLPGAVHGVQLLALATTSLQPQQPSLWRDFAPNHPQQLAQLIDRLSSRLGTQAVCQARLRAGALPEESYTRVPLLSSVARQMTSGNHRQAGSASPRGSRRRSLAASQAIDSAASPGRSSAASGSPTVFLPHQRPLQLLHPPRPLTGMWGAPEDPPVWFRYLGHTYHVQSHWGPERIETAWWQGPCVRRDYYRVQSTSGQRFWLFRQLNDHRWFLHGHFE